MNVFLPQAEQKETNQGKARSQRKAMSPRVSETRHSAHRGRRKASLVSKSGYSAHRDRLKAPLVSKSGYSAHRGCLKTPLVSKTG